VIADDHVEYPGRARDRLACEAVRIAGPVPALVRVTHDRHHALEEADRLEDARAEQWMLADDRELFRREWAVLAEDRCGDADLPERMEQRRVAEVAQLVGSQAN